MIGVYQKDHAIFSEEAKKRDFKFCVMFNKIMKRYFPDRY